MHYTNYINDLESSNCINCDISSKYHNVVSIKDNSYYKNHKWIIVECDCGFIYLNPRIKESNIHKYYNNNYLPHITKKNIFYSTIRIITNKWKRNIINKYINKNKYILDFGSGDNSFGQYMNKNGFNVTSYDLYSGGNTTKINNKIRFNIITLWHSLEHLYDLKENFKFLHNKLHDNGYLFIAVPNHNSIDRKYFKNKWIAYDPPRHLYHFTVNSLSKVLLNSNIKVLKTFPMYQDTLFNVFYSLKLPIFLKFVISPLLVILFLIIIIFNKNYSSSTLFICKKF